MVFILTLNLINFISYSKRAFQNKKIIWHVKDVTRLSNGIIVKIISISKRLSSQFKTNSASILELVHNSFLGETPFFVTAAACIWLQHGQCKQKDLFT